MTKQKVQYYLGQTTVDEAATWMDDMRSNHMDDYMKPWHFINIEKGDSYGPNNGPNSIMELNHCINELQHREGVSDARIKTDILIRFHLVGNLHQPLHVGYGSDIGGNKRGVTFFDGQTNLHKAWELLRITTLRWAIASQSILFLCRN